MEKNFKTQIEYLNNRITAVSNFNQLIRVRRKSRKTPHFDKKLGELIMEVLKYYPQQSIMDVLVSKSYKF